MALTYVAADTTITSGASPRTVDLPAGTTLDDWVILVVSNGSAEVTPTAPSGFDEVVAAYQSTLPSIRVYMKRATGSEPSTYDVTFPSGNDHSISAFTLRPDSGYVVAVDDVQISTNASGNRVYPAVTATVTDTILACIGSISGNIGTAADGAMTERWDAGTNPRIYLMTQSIAATGTTGTRTATGISAASSVVSLLLRQELDVPPEVTDEFVTQAGVIVELESDGGQLFATQAGVIIELAAIGVRVTQSGIIFELEEESALPTYEVRRNGGRGVHARLPDEVTGYAFDPAHSWWSVVVPEETENLIENSSFENGSTGYLVAGLASSSIVSGDAIGAARGSRAFQFANSSGVQGGISGSTATSVAAGAYTFSADVYVPRTDVKLMLRLTGGGGALRDNTFTFWRTGWQRIDTTLVTLAAGAMTYALISPATNTVSATFRTDGWQLENKRYATTYADGDMTGWFDTLSNQSYYWTGVPHQSTSVRKANTGTGGRIVYFSDLVDGVDFNTTAIVGGGMVPVEQDVVRVGYEREVHRGVRILPRDFTVTGRVIACSYENLYKARQRLIDLVRPNKTLRREPIILRYQITDDTGREASNALEIICSYQDGLRGNVTNFYQEAIGMQFHASSPYWIEDIDNSVDLGSTPYTSLTSNRLIYRDADGLYQNLGTGTTDDVILAVAFDADGYPIVGGDFSTIGGDAVSFIARWDGSDWQEIGATSPNNDVHSIGIIPETGVILVGGEFTTYDGPAKRIAYFDGSNWNELAGGFTTGQVEVIEHDRYSGQIYASGAHNGGSEWVFRADLDGVSWTALPNGGLSQSPLTILSTHDGYIWFGGSFQTSGDSSIVLRRVARYSIEGNVWEALDAGFDGVVSNLIQGRDGFVYAFGGFAMDGDNNYSLINCARWNGTTWEQVDAPPGFALTMNDVAVDPNGVFWFGDSSAKFETVYGENWMAGWYNGVTYPQPFEIPDDTNGINRIIFGPNNEMLVATQLSSASATLAPRLIEATVGGDADSMPTFILRNKQTPKFIQNLDAEVGIYFRDNFKVVDNERLFIDFAGSRPRLHSDARPNLMRHIYTGASNVGSMKLRPGVNRISILCTEDDGDVTLRNSLIWRNRFLSMDAVQTL